MHSREGYEIDTQDRRWVLSRDVTVKLEWVDRSIDEPLREGFLIMASWYASTRAPGTTAAAVQTFKYLIDFLKEARHPIRELTHLDLINFRSSRGHAREHELVPLVVFLRHWLRQQVVGIRPELIHTLSQWKIKSAPKGVAVLTCCPHKGALSDLEFQGLESHLIQALESRQISLSNYVSADLMISTGRRPSQLGDLKLGDIVVSEGEGHKDCGLIVQFPRRKQGRVWRAAFKPAYLTTEKAAALLELKAVTSRRLKRLWPTLSERDVDKFPLFPAWGQLRKCKDLSVADVMELAQSERFHAKTKSLGRRLDRTVKRLAVSSERTMNYLRVFPLRLRRSVATRAAREGYGTLVIAELLDHTDDQNARVYTENVPEHAAAIDAAVAMQLAPIVQAFSGMLVDREADALRGNDIASRVRMDDGRNIGSCGSFGFCGALSPVACYTCKAFQPWLDAPHRDVFDGLVDERERIRKITRDDAISSINDRTIFAVAEVIRLCEQRNAELRSRCDGQSG